MFFLFLSTVLLVSCKEGTFVYTPPQPLTNAPSGSTHRVPDPCIANSGCVLSYLKYDECIPRPHWACCPSEPTTHSVTGGIGFINNGGSGEILMRGVSPEGGCSKSIDLNGIFHISIARQDEHLLENDTVRIESRLFRNNDEISISPIYRVQSEMNSLANTETDLITKDNYVIYCKEDTVTANIIVDYGIVSHTEPLRSIWNNSEVAYKLVIYIRDLHDIPTYESCSPRYPITLEDFEKLEYDSPDCHLSDHIMIVSIPLCGTVYEAEPIEIPVRKH